MCGTCTDTIERTIVDHSRIAIVQLVVRSACSMNNGTISYICLFRKDLKTLSFHYSFGHVQLSLQISPDIIPRETLCD